VIASVLIAVAFAVPLLILGLAALIGGRPEDMPAIMYALARGAEAGTVPGGAAIVVAAESVRAGGQGSNGNPLPAGQRACYNDKLSPENLIRDLIRADRDPAWPLTLAQLAGRAPDPLACDAPLAAAVAAQAAAQGLAFIDRAAADAVANGTLELVLPGWQWRRRTWASHQDCSCGSTTFRRGE
jgi:hypothetical protein